jgi:hypothetical protein
MQEILPRCPKCSNVWAAHSVQGQKETKPKKICPAKINGRLPFPCESPQRSSQQHRPHRSSVNRDSKLQGACWHRLTRSGRHQCPSSPYAHTVRREIATASRPPLILTVLFDRQSHRSPFPHITPHFPAAGGFAATPASAPSAESTLGKMLGCWPRLCIYKA